jgi:UDP-N-acetylglucosamine:LPS N-acetylglucosamine transferase
MAGDDKVDVLLVCSAGGHLLQLWSLREAWVDRTRTWVVVPGQDPSDVTSLLEGECVYAAHAPTARNLRNLVRNTLLAWRLLQRLQPAIVITTGAAIAVPFAWLARIHGARVVYIETLSRVERPSLSCRLVGRSANRIYVQWPELAKAVRRGRYAGTVIGA